MKVYHEISILQDNFAWNMEEDAFSYVIGQLPGRRGKKNKV